MKTQYCSAQPQGKNIQGSGPDHTPAYILSYATEGISRTLILFSLEGGRQYFERITRTVVWTTWPVV